MLRGASEDKAVALALADFSRFAPGTDRGLEPPTEESAVQSGAIQSLVAPDPLQVDLAASLGMTTAKALAAGLEDVVARPQDSPGAQFDQWLYTEQSALVEGLVRAYARRRLRPLLGEYEVLEIEREGEWELASGGTTYDIDATGRYENHDGDWHIRFMSRPDALLRSRADGGLYILSYKTAGSWDVRKQRDAQVDMQGLSEGVEVERRLGDWWRRIQNGDAEIPGPDSIVRYLRDLPAPPRVLGIRYEFLLKGDRWKDADLTRRFGFDARSQRSPLIRCYVAHSTPSRGKNVGSYDIGALAWSWDYHLEDGSATKLSASNWHSAPVWERMPIREWINLLDSATETMSGEDSTVGLAPRSLGWRSDAQATGFTAQHPLDSVFVPPVIVYRQEDAVRDWIEQVEAQERKVADGVAWVAATQDNDSRRSAMNALFPQTRHACEYPSTCAMSRICWGGEDIQRDPLGSGVYVRREPHHAPEAAAVASGIPEEPKP